jgi:signal peptidase II
MNTRCTLTGLTIAILVLAFDQASKWFFLEVVQVAIRPPIEVLPFFNLVMVWNTGISFGMFAEGGKPYILAAISLTIMLILVFWLAKSHSRLTAAALGSTLGGAAGNVIDRLHFGAVADFFDFHIGAYHWPAFNIADSAIFIGVVLLCAGGMFMGPKKDSQGTSS